MQDDAGLVERIAHSLWNATDHHSPWGEIVALYETTHNEYLTMARSALAAIEAAGLKVVPVEPTQNMTLQGSVIPVGSDFDGPTIYVGWPAAREVYVAMLSAAPKPG